MVGTENLTASTYTFAQIHVWILTFTIIVRNSVYRNRAYIQSIYAGLAVAEETGMSGESIPSLPLRPCRIRYYNIGMFRIVFNLALV